MTPRAKPCAAATVAPDAGFAKAAGQPSDGAILLAIHIDTDRVDEATELVESHRGEVIDVIRLGGSWLEPRVSRRPRDARDRWPR
jgi:hypothetical protein